MGPQSEQCNTTRRGSIVWNGRLALGMKCFSSHDLCCTIKCLYHVQLVSFVQAASISLLDRQNCSSLTSPHIPSCSHAEDEPRCMKSSRLAKILDALIDRIHGLRIHRRSTGRFAKDQLRLQAPSRWHVVCRLELDVDGWVVVLEIASQAFGFEGGPEHVLMHTAGVGGP